MSQRVREELLPRWRQRYANRGREGKSRLIDELVEDFGYSRKHASLGYQSPVEFEAKFLPPMGGKGTASLTTCSDNN